MQHIEIPIQTHVFYGCMILTLVACICLFKHYGNVAKESVLVRIHAVIFVGASFVAIQIAVLQVFMGPIQVALQPADPLTWYQLLGLGANGPVWHFIATGRLRALLEQRRCITKHSTD